MQIKRCVPQARARIVNAIEMEKAEEAKKECAERIMLSKVRKEVVEFIYEFNTALWPVVRPLLKESGLAYFPISDGNIKIGTDSWYPGYSVVFGEKPKITLPPISVEHRRDHIEEMFDIGKGLRRWKPDKDMSYLCIDLAKDAISYAEEGESPIKAYKRNVEDDFKYALDFLIESIEYEKREARR